MRFIQIFSFIMVAVYAGLGILFLAVSGFYPEFDGTPRILLGLLLVLYAFYRAFRVVKQLFGGNEQ